MSSIRLILGGLRLHNYAPLSICQAYIYDNLRVSKASKHRRTSFIMRFRNFMLWPFPSLLLALLPLITGLSDKELDICRDLGFIVNTGLTTIKFKGKSRGIISSVIYMYLLSQLTMT